MTGTGNNRRIIDLNTVAIDAFEKLNKTNCSKEVFLKSLIGYHNFSGCETTSAFAGRGKIKPLLVMLNSVRHIENFSHFGECINLEEGMFKELEQFVCHMYGKNISPDNLASINTVWYNLYCQREGKILSDFLPPCENVLHQHLRRANYQAWIWRNDMVPQMNVDEPIDHGWHSNQGLLDIEWMACKPAPEEVIKLTIFYFANLLHAMTKLIRNLHELF